MKEPLVKEVSNTYSLFIIFQSYLSQSPAKCDCHGHGQCATINTIYENLIAPVYYEGSYSLWDKESTSACICDMGYTGPGCTMSKSTSI